MFSWVSTHKAIAQKLTTYENRQPELIELLKYCGETILNDIDVDGSEIHLKEIDPFTFFFYLYKYGTAKRIERLRCVAQNLDISPLPDDTDGLPSANAQKVRLFPNKKDRNDSEIARLWHFFKTAMNDQLNNDLFLDILTINGVGKTKITESLFYIKPEKYLPINAQTRPYLEEVLEIDPRFDNFQDYLSILDKVKAKASDPFYKISHDAWVWNTSKSQTGNTNQKDDDLEAEKIDNFSVQENVLIETLAEFDHSPCTDLFYKQIDKLIKNAGITPDQCHASVRKDIRIPITLGRRYVIMIKRKGNSVIWGLILKAEDETSASQHAYYDNSSFFVDTDGGKSYCWAEFIVPFDHNASDLDTLFDMWQNAASCYYHEIKNTQFKNIYKRHTNDAVVKSLFDPAYRKQILDKAADYARFPVQKKLIEKYKALIKAIGLEYEKFKWELLGKTYWDFQTSDIKVMIDNLPLAQLVYPMAISVLKQLADHDPERLQSIMEELFQETDSLSDRLKEFRAKIDAFFKEIKPSLPSHHDERTAATYLAFFNPEKYPLYKNSFYSKYCKLLGKKQAPTNEKYQHYIELITDLISNHINEDQELLQLYESIKVEDGFADKNRLLLSQDLLFRVLDGRFDELLGLKKGHKTSTQVNGKSQKKIKSEEPLSEENKPKTPTPSEINYWWLSTNPAIQSFSQWKTGDKLKYPARNERGNKRRIFKHFKTLQAGDRMIGYETSPVKQIKALFEITRGLEKQDGQETIEFELLEKLEIPVDWTELKNYPALRHCEVLQNNQGTLFKLTEEEFDVIQEIIDNKNIIAEKEKEKSPEIYNFESDADKPFLPVAEFKTIINLLKRKKTSFCKVRRASAKLFWPESWLMK